MTAGDQFGRYKIIRLIGRGAMGEVYLARDTESQRDIALKIVYKGPDAEDQDILDAERLGAELQKRLSGADRRVVAVHRYGEINGDLFVEMEYIEGEDLSTILSRGSVSPGFATLVTIELCEMLEKLGAFQTTIGDRQFSGIVHGDLKPRNVRLNQQNQVKALDFGIAKALSHTRKYTMNVFASTAYCSPERLETQNMDTHSDLWSVGVLLYQMLAGRLPFDETSKERLERRIRSSMPPMPLPAECPDGLRQIAFKMLAREPDRRYQTATEAREDLERFRRGENVKADTVFDTGDTVRTSTDTPTATQAGEATVRTAPPPPPSFIPPRFDEATVRTAAGAARPATPSPRDQPVIWPPKGLRSQNTLGCMAAFGVICLVIVMFVVSQVNIFNDADKLRIDLQSERTTNLDGAWNEYQTLAQRVHFGASLWGARNALKRRLIAAADDVIVEYRNNDTPNVSEAQWIEARNHLARAMELDGGGDEIKGRLRLCEGHLDQIYGDRSKSAKAQKLWNAAAAKFTEASELLPKSPDPYLGLARLYTYELNDMDKAEEALKKAADYGHAMGHRETAQLADGYRRRADRIWKESRGLTDLPDQERDFLNKAKQDYKQAQDLYKQIGMFGDAARNQALALQGEQRVEARLSELAWGNLFK